MRWWRSHLEKPGHSLHLCTGLKEKWWHLTTRSPVLLENMQAACACPQGAAGRQVLRALSSLWAALLHGQGAASLYSLCVSSLTSPSYQSLAGLEITSGLGRRFILTGENLSWGKGSFGAQQLAHST